MRTLVGAADPEPRVPVTAAFSVNTGSSTINTTATMMLTWTVSPTAACAAQPVWPEPYRTTAYVGESIRELTD